MAVIGADELATRLQLLCYQHLRLPATYSTDDVTGDPVLTFEPPLTAEEQTTYDELLTTARAELDPGFPLTLTPAQRAALRADLQTLRALRQLGRNAFLGLTAAERDRQLYDAQTATTVILLAILRS